MQDKSDAQLLREYAESGNETAFRDIVARHTDLVYSAALRQVALEDLAQDISQSVFVDLARKAKEVSERLPANASLVGWLYRSTRFAVLNHLRDNRRRAMHERQAMEQLIIDSGPGQEWERICPLLDEAMAHLSDEDREALLLRYFKNHDFRAVGDALGTSDDAAQKRVSRAVERLREFFSKRGVGIGASGLVVLISANAVQAAPLALAATISTAALLAGTTAVHTSTAIATKAIAMTLLQKAIITASVAIMAGTGIYEAHQAAQLRAQIQTVQQQQAPLTAQVRQLQQERDNATNELASVAVELEKIKSGNLELLKLRGQVTSLQNELTKQIAANSASRDDSTNTDDSEPPYKRHAKLLMRYFDTNPGAQIPEMKLLPKEPMAASIYGLAVKLAAQYDTANYGKQGVFDENRIKLETNEEYRRAASELRSFAEYSVAPTFLEGLKEYRQANNGAYPKSVSELQAFFKSPMDDSILQRYEVQPASNFSKVQAKYDSSVQITGFVITPKTAVDEDFDHRIIIGQTNYMVGDPGSFKP